MPPETSWLRYVEDKYGVRLRSETRPVDVANLFATQTEIELVKYKLVREEGFRVDEPVVAFQGGRGRIYLIDGHTRARVVFDRDRPSLPAVVLACDDLRVAEEVHRMAELAGGGEVKQVREIPIVDRLGEGSEAWRRRRQELLDKWRRSREG